ncbi:hypothetical protein BGZ80_008207, partial [Entomortierella chlamydospora]
RTSAASSASLVKPKAPSSVGGASSTGSVHSARSSSATGSETIELKKELAIIREKYEEASAALKAKEEELVVLRGQLESGSSSHADAFADTVSSDGGETVVPEIDLTKIEAQSQTIVAEAVAAKEQEIAALKSEIESLSSLVKELRDEHENKIKELTDMQAEKNAEQEEELLSLQIKLEEYSKKNEE